MHRFILDQDTLRDSAANLSEMSNKLSSASMTEDRDLLHANLTENARELERLQNLTRLSESLHVLLNLYFLCV